MDERFAATEKSMNAVRGFFALDGRGSAQRFAVATVLCLAILWVCSHADYTYGLLTNIVAGAIGGAAVAKMVIEAIRWSRPRGDARVAVDGSGGWAGTILALICISGGVIVLGGIAYISIGMRKESDRVHAWRAAKDHRAPDR